ncbi:MAG: DNA primase [Clostridiales bacterium]|nr:DNA primase [Clostridiales bacterium]
MAGRIPSAWMDELYARTDIVSVVSSYLTLKKDGRRYWGLCPFHNEKTASFSVNADLNLYYCFGCKAGGNVVQFVMEMERVPFIDAVKLLADRIHLPMPELTDDPDYERKRSQRERMHAANREAARFYHDMLWKAEGKKILDYLYSRGLDDGTIRKFGLGASSERWDDLTRFLQDKGYTLEELGQAGLSVVKGDHAYDMFRNRAIFPIIDQHGNVLGFGGRAMGDAKPKYLNTSDTPVFNKRKGVYAINLLRKIRDLKRVLLVEGYMDVVAITQAGVTGAVATLGTALTNEQARLLKRYAPEVHLAYDGDEAGQMAIERALSIFESEAIPAKVLYFPDKLDPDEFIRQRGLEAFKAMKPMSAVSYRMQRLRLKHDLETQEGRTEYAKACAELLKKVRDPVDLENYLDLLHVQTGFSREVLLAQIGVAPQDMGQQNNQPPKRENLSAKRVRLPEGYRTEQTLLALLGTGKLPSGMVKADDFSDDTLHTIAQQLLEGKSPAEIMNDAQEDAIRQAAGEAFTMLSDSERENAAVIAGDCLRNLQIQRLQQEINAMTELMKTAQSPEQRGNALKEVAALSKELARLKQQGR